MKKPPSQGAERPGSVIMRRRQLAADAIRADPACSDRSIAYDLGVSRFLVARMRRELAAAGEAVLGLPVRGRDGLTYQFRTRHGSRVAELDRLYRRLYPVVRVVESEEFARTYRSGSETQRGVLRRIVERLRKRLDRLDRL